jgi:tRNA (cytidine/uridine-2'-O-)-methyltransferase
VNIVLVHPQIPQNTGSIARSCASLKCPLHLVGPYPFEITEKKVRRAGLDYWPYVELYQHENWDNFLSSIPNSARLVFVDNPGNTIYTDYSFQKDDFLIFGSETKGIPKDILSKHSDSQLLEIPMIEKNVRSLNLSNAVSIVLFEAYRQISRNI